MVSAAYYYMPHFKPGASVQWKHQRETVSHVMVRRNAMVVFLVGHDLPVYPEALQLAPSAFHLKRVADQF